MHAKPIIDELSLIRITPRINVPENDNKPTFRAGSLSQVGAVAATRRTQPVDGDTAAHAVDGFAEESGLLDGGLRNSIYGGFSTFDAVLHINKVCFKTSKSYIKCCYVSLPSQPLIKHNEKPHMLIKSTNITKSIMGPGIIFMNKTNISKDQNIIIKTH